MTEREKREQRIDEVCATMTDREYYAICEEAISNEAWNTREEAQEWWCWRLGIPYDNPKEN